MTIGLGECIVTSPAKSAKVLNRRLTLLIRKSAVFGKEVEIQHTDLRNQVRLKSR